MLNRLFGRQPEPHKEPLIDEKEQQAKALFYEGNNAYTQSNFPEAVSAFDVALAIKPNMHEALFGKGAALDKLGCYEEAIAAFDAALAIKPDMHEALFGKGISLTKLDCYEEAITAFDAAFTVKLGEQARSDQSYKDISLIESRRYGEVLEEISQTPYPIDTAKRYIDKAATETLWDRADRTLVCTTGGAFLGVLIAQLPGAVVVGLLAGIYGWFAKSRPQRDLV